MLNDNNKAYLEGVKDSVRAGYEILMVSFKRYTCHSFVYLSLFLGFVWGNSKSRHGNQCELLHMSAMFLVTYYVHFCVSFLNLCMINHIINESYECLNKSMLILNNWLQA